LNAQLAGDPALQALHSQMISEANQLVSNFYAGQLDNDQMLYRYSDLATRYSISFAQYVNTNRVYSLEYEEPGLDGSFDILRGIANQPRAGYYCSVGNISFQDYMLSIDIHVLAKPGAGLRNYEGELLSRIGHLNSAVLLPNGEMLFTDMTPIRPNPGEDLSALDEVAPNKRTNPLETAAKVGGALVITSSVYVAGREVRRRRKRAFESRIDGFLPENKDEAATILAALEHILMYVLEISDEEKADRMLGASYHPNRESLLVSLAGDALSIISSERSTQGNSSTIREMLIGSAKRLKLSKKSQSDEDVSTYLAQIDKDSRTIISRDLDLIWREVKKQRKGKVERLKGELAELNQRLEALLSNFSTGEQDFEIEELQKQIDVKLQKISKLELGSQSIRSILRLLSKAGS